MVENKKRACYKNQNETIPIKVKLVCVKILFLAALVQVMELKLVIEFDFVKTLAANILGFIDNKKSTSAVLEILILCIYCSCVIGDDGAGERILVPSVNFPSNSATPQACIQYVIHPICLNTRDLCASKKIGNPRRAHIAPTGPQRLIQNYIRSKQASNYASCQ